MKIWIWAYVLLVLWGLFVGWNIYQLYVVPMEREHTEQLEAIARDREAIIDAQLIEETREQEKLRFLKEMFDRGIARGTAPNYKNPKQGN